MCLAVCPPCSVAVTPSVSSDAAGDAAPVTPATPGRRSLAVAFGFAAGPSDVRGGRQLTPKATPSVASSGDSSERCPPSNSDLVARQACMHWP